MSSSTLCWICECGMINNEWIKICVKCFKSAPEEKETEEEKKKNEADLQYDIWLERTAFDEGKSIENMTDDEVASDAGNDEEGEAKEIGEVSESAESNTKKSNANHTSEHKVCQNEKKAAETDKSAKISKTKKRMTKKKQNKKRKVLTEAGTSSINDEMENLSNSFTAHCSTDDDDE